MPEVARRDHATTEQLSALLDNRAEPGELPFLTDHVVGCDACRRELNELGAVRDLLRRLPIELPPRSFTLAPPARPAPRFRRLIPITRALSAIAAIFCVLLFAADAMGTTYEPAPVQKVTSAIRPDVAAKPAESVNRAAPAATVAPAAPASQPAPRAARPAQAQPTVAASEAPPAAAAPAIAAAPPPQAQPQPAPAAPSGRGASSASSTSPSGGTSGRSADSALATPSGAGAALAPTAAQSQAPATVTAMATSGPSAAPTTQAFAPAAAPPAQTEGLLGLSPLRAASLILGLAAVILFLGSVLLKRVALAPLDARYDGLDR